MKARLTRIEAKRRGESLPLGDTEVRVGRDPDSDLVIGGVRASRLHALVRPLGGRHTLSDTGSTNGTTVNGVALGRSPVLLENGDLVEFAGEYRYVYETGPTVSARRWSLLAGAMLVLLAVSGALAYWRLAVDRPVLSEAVELARAGRAAGERGDFSQADARLREAARLLIRAGYLDHVDRSDLLPAALERLENELGGGTDLAALIEQADAVHQQRVDEVIGEGMSDPPVLESGIGAPAADPVPAVGEPSLPPNDAVAPAELDGVGTETPDPGTP